ncbi:MAG: hypothetical protein J6B23_09490 [Clostridia bacterium]|nr:hypothetical protein [Clostridia bacterium]
MEPRFYTLTRIEGEYAYLEDKDTGNEIFIALALLPEGADINTNLKCEMFEYTIV